jgi:hypothetical protein
MNPWTIMLGNSVSPNAVFYGSYASEANAIAAIAGTGKPWLYQAVEVFGAGTSYPPGIQPAPTVAPGAWLALAFGTTGDGNLKGFAYGTFTDQVSALAWANLGQAQGNFSVGLVGYLP